MDKDTINYYNLNAMQVYETYSNSDSSWIEERFKEAFPEKNSRILDIGAGSGRDMLFLLKSGYDVYGCDASQELVNISLSRNPELKGRLIYMQFPPNDNPFPYKFDGILISAVLMHIYKENLFSLVYALKEYIVDGGKILISLPEYSSSIQNNRDQKNRLMIQYNVIFLQLIFERAGFTFINKWKSADSLGRAYIKWNSLLFQYHSSLYLRPLDKIEQILNKDSKVTTYKLALIRSLCDISINAFNSVNWLGENVYIPINLIINRWIKYYWYLFEVDGAFVPQHTGENPNNIKIRFRSILSQIIEYYKYRGSYQKYDQDKKQECFNLDIKGLDSELEEKIKLSIVKGPVQYSGTGYSSEMFFQYDRKSESVIMQASLWKEICLMNHWIEDALVLRWAELTSNISKENLNPGFIISLLLKKDFIERDTELARSIYDKLERKKCIWSGHEISSDYDVDHVIPFKLWQNNNLWNLLPSDPTINRKKSYFLPSNQILFDRKDLILYYWEILHQAFPNRFQKEFFEITGLNEFSEDWKDHLFSILVESIEITAMQRGIQRWSPKK